MAASSCYVMPAISSMPSSKRANLNLVFGFSKNVSPLKRDLKFTVRSSAEENEVKVPAEALPKPTPPKPKVSTNFSDVLAFSAPAPERINGRLAMIGFVAAMGVELANGQDIFSQIQNGGVPLFLGTTALLSLASLIPMFSGVTVESKSKGLMTSDAELWNGRFAMLGLAALAFTERFAMLGLAALAFTEFVTGSALV